MNKEITVDNLFDEGVNIEDFLDGDSTELDFDVEDFDFGDFDNETNPRISRPVLSRRGMPKSYTHAKKMAEGIEITKNMQTHYLCPGAFIFGDFFEAFLVEKRMKAEELFISTLSMSENNIDSLRTLLEKGYCEKLTIMISNYFYSHERGNLMKHLVDELDFEDRTDVIVNRNHTKIVLMKIEDLYIVISGSANLRSSASLEQIIIQEDKVLYEYYKDWFVDQLGKYGIINHSIEKG